MNIALPCRCNIDMDVTTFKTGHRGITCPRHERSFVVEAVMPKTPNYVVNREIPYKKQTQP